MAGHLADHEFYVVEADNDPRYDHMCRMMALPYDVAQLSYCLDAVVCMMNIDTITREDLKRYFRASRHIDPKKLRACFADMDNICNELHRLERAYSNERMKLATIGIWSCRELCT